MQSSQNKITVVLLPGLNGTKGLFKKFIESSPDGFEPLALAYPCDKPLTYRELTGYVNDKLTDIAGPYILLGESFSGPLSLFVANENPEKVLAVILIASFIKPPRSKFLKRLPWAIGFHLTKPLYELRGLLSKLSDASDLIRAISEELRKVKPEVLAARVAETQSVNATNALIDCRAPVLYLQASKDWVVPKSSLHNILEARSSVSTEVFQTQHFLLQSAPKEAWLAIQRFVSSISPARGTAA